jgi:hypothetical protein
VARPGALVALSVWGTQAASPMFTLFGSCVAELRATGQLPPLAPGTPPPARASFHLGADDAGLRRCCASVGLEGAVSWHVPCLWGQQKGHDFARTFTGAQPACSGVLGPLSDAQRPLVVDLMARRADEVLARGQPIACDVVIVMARVPAS